MTDLAPYAAIIGAKNLLTGDAAAPYFTDWTGSYSGQADAVLRPGSTAEVSDIMKLSRATGMPITLQGGNTSVAGGSVPKGGLLLSLTRMRAVRDIDLAARTAVAEAGVVLQVLQDQLAGAGLDFPLYFGARGSATVGGALATNAGGANVLRYGNARDLCLGIEAVLPDGQVMSGLSGLRKDNSGYDLRHLLIGAEGTLGVITAATLHLVPRPRSRATAFLSVAGLEAGLEVLNALQDATGGLVEAFEWMPSDMVDAIRAHRPDLPPPLATPAAHGILVEVASTRPDAGLDEALLHVVSAQMEAGRVLDGRLASSGRERTDLWQLREAVLEAIRAQAPYTVLDAALPLSRVAGFVERADKLAAAAGLKPLLVGHLGDGNIHYAVAAQAVWEPDVVAQFSDQVTDLIMESGGTFSAEHGIGRSKAGVLAARKDPAQLAMMRALKAAVDPDHLLNRGVFFDQSSA